jgi:hypothetical protein
MRLALRWMMAFCGGPERAWSVGFTLHTEAPTKASKKEYRVTKTPSRTAEAQRLRTVEQWLSREGTGREVNYPTHLYPQDASSTACTIDPCTIIRRSTNYEQGLKSGRGA